MTKLEKELAYFAGRHAITEPAERRSVEACPFPGGDERAEWLRGFADAVNDVAVSPTLVKEVNDAVASADAV